MASLFDRVANRSAYPVEINGATVHVREPSYDIIDRVKGMQAVDGEDLRTALTLALCVVNDDGSPAFPKVDGETDQQLAKRVAIEAKVLTPSDMRKIHDAISKLLKLAEPDELVKN